MYFIKKVFELLYKTHVGGFRSPWSVLPINKHIFFFSDALDAVTVIFQPIDYSCLFCLLDGMNIKLGYVRLG